MKKLIFLENDYPCPAAEESINSGKSNLRRHFELTRERIEEMQIIYQFHLLKNEEAYDILFDKNNILVTYSMYCQGSDYAMLHFLEMAAKNGIRDVVYLDTSGQLLDLLNKRLRDNKDAFAIACGVNTNYILTISQDAEDYGKVWRIVVKNDGYWDDCATLESIHLDLLNKKEQTV